jgi:adenosylcobinamide kinase/adenosylcobinamide-phosphate guanylyltransferase
VITLVLGGARSGKSEVAEAIAARLPAPVTYLATAFVEPGDEEWATRVAAHRQRRDPSWRTVEVGPDLPQAIEGIDGSILVDSLGTWVGRAAQAVDPSPLVRALAGRTGDAVLVSEEVGLGVHPSTERGRHFRDALGDVNRAVARIADEVLLVVAGRVLPLARP